MHYLTFIKILALFALAFSCMASPPVPGVVYQDFRHENGTTIHVLTLDPQKVKIVAVRAQDAGAGLASVNELASKFSAVAAINGGFFSLDQPDIAVSAGALKLDTTWHGIAYQARGAIGWDSHANVFMIDVIQTQSKLSINNKTVPIHAMNRILAGNKASLLSDSYMLPINIEKNLKSMSILFANNQITKIYSTGQMNIPHDTYAYYLSGKLAKKIRGVKIGDPVNLQITVSPQLSPSTSSLWNNMPFIVGGGPVLIHNAKIVSDFAVEKLSDSFLNMPHARTAFGILPDKQVVMVFAERNLLQDTAGLSIPELSEFMQSLGCVAALNLDGGSSSAMYLVNHRLGDFSFGRDVANAILVLPRS